MRSKPNKTKIKHQINKKQKNQKSTIRMHLQRTRLPLTIANRRRLKWESPMVAKTRLSKMSKRLHKMVSNRMKRQMVAWSQSTTSSMT